MHTMLPVKLLVLYFALLVDSGLNEFMWLDLFWHQETCKTPATYPVLKPEVRDRAN
jgi:hypothetical protein